MTETQTEINSRRDGPQVLPTGNWQEDVAASEISFRTRSMFGLLGVHGSFESRAGSLKVDSEGRATGILEIDAGSVATGIQKRDHHLASSDFFDADGHPTILFRLTGVQPATEGGSTLEGELDVRDVKIAAKAPLGIEKLGPDRIRLTAEIVVDHHAAGLGWRKLGMVRAKIPVRAAIVLDRLPLES